MLKRSSSEIGSPGSRRSTVCPRNSRCRALLLVTADGLRASSGGPLRIVARRPWDTTRCSPTFSRLRLWGIAERAGSSAPTHADRLERVASSCRGYPGGDPCLRWTGLPQALSARALRTRRTGRGTDAPVDSGDRDAADLGSRAWLRRAAGRCRRGVTMLPSVEKKTAQLCRR
jgi:hypothetical protein